MELAENYKEIVVNSNKYRIQKFNVKDAFLYLDELKDQMQGLQMGDSVSISDMMVNFVRSLSLVGIYDFALRVFPGYVTVNGNKLHELNMNSAFENSPEDIIKILRTMIEFNYANFFLELQEAFSKLLGIMANAGEKTAHSLSKEKN